MLSVTKYVGRWKQGIMDTDIGHARYSYANGDKFEGRYSKGLKSGRGVYSYKNGSMFFEKWKYGQRTGDRFL